VVHEAVDHGGGHDGVAEDLTPSTWKWHTFSRADLSR